MNPLLKHKEEIAKKFVACESIDDLVLLLNKIDKWQHENPYFEYKRKAITVKQLNYFLYGKKDKYTTFEIPKKSGGIRVIKKPHRFLRKIQRLLNICFNACFTPMPTATGFISGRSIVDNAKKHTGKKYVYNIDLQDYFPNINFGRIRAVLHKVKPFELNADVAHIVANLCCDEGVLPQGAPTSPTLSNFVCKRLDARFYYLAKEMNFTFSRYADDITISSNKDIYTEEFKKQVAEIIEEEGFSLNQGKERLQISNIRGEDGKMIRERQTVTGIIVNGKTSLPKHYVRSLQATIHNWENYGYEISSMLHEHFYKREKGFLKYNGAIPNIEQVVHGKIEYLGMVRGKEDTTYRLLRMKFDSLCKKENYTPKEFKEILEIWKSQGIKKAMDKFYDRKNLLING